MTQTPPPTPLTNDEILKLQLSLEDTITQFMRNNNVHLSGYKLRDIEQAAEIAMNHALRTN